MLGKGRGRIYKACQLYDPLHTVQISRSIPQDRQAAEDTKPGGSLSFFQSEVLPQLPGVLQFTIYLRRLAGSKYQLSDLHTRTVNGGGRVSFRQNNAKFL